MTDNGSFARLKERTWFHASQTEKPTSSLNNFGLGFELNNVLGSNGLVRSSTNFSHEHDKNKTENNPIIQQIKRLVNTKDQLYKLFPSI